MTLIDLPVGGRAADDLSQDQDIWAPSSQDRDVLDDDVRIEQRGVSWARVDDPEELVADESWARVDDPEELVTDEPQRTSYPRCADGNGTLTHLFFSDDEFDIARAKAICGKCGLASSCLSSALERAEPYGVWGGSLVIDGVIVEVKRGRGRPPKNPRPPLVVDEVPLPPHLVA